MNIPFWKMHGAGNDFILVDDRAETFPISDAEWLRLIAQRRTGIGCEGIILLQPSDDADIRMRFFNPDGNEVEMCGNGARCIARLASEIGAAGNRMTIETVAGTLHAEIIDENVRLLLTPPHGMVTEQTLNLDGKDLTYSFVNTGVPHVVIVDDDLPSVDVDTVGRGIRHHDAFAPAGTNVNFASPTGPQELSVRTYERGVEAETLACGTGIVASAIISVKLGLVSAPVHVTAASGDILIVDCKISGDTVESASLLGPAVHVFEGSLQH